MTEQNKNDNKGKKELSNRQKKKKKYWYNRKKKRSKRQVTEADLLRLKEHFERNNSGSR